MKVALFALLAFVAVAFALPRFEIPAPQAGGQNWALVVAGSNTYMNYRHQADVCHSYHVLNSHGIPSSNIVVMMYDDIANSSENPNKGEIINKPNGPNVYPGVPKDCVGDDVTAANFLAILSGDKSKVKGCNNAAKIINSGPNDNIFVYFSDHGAPSLVAMPTGPYLYAKDLMATLTGMAKAKKFHQLVFYLESCESGSMFDKILPNNINIYATTAANPDESSYACYWDDTRQAYLGDLYSVNWLENSDIADFSKETLHQQFIAVQNATNLSHVMQYGQLTMANEPLQNFQSSGKFVAREASPASLFPSSTVETLPQFSAVSSRDVVVDTLHRRWKLAKTPEAQVAAKAALEAEIASRDHETSKMQKLVQEVAKTESVPHALFTERHPAEHECMPTMVEAVEAACGRFTDFSLGLTYVLNNLCHHRVSPATVARAAQAVC